ncbi:Di-trans-poly-cis-decaprenylcistransferase [Daedalea quercina L-15889]|uniref:Alkyl transferase n=1 Tax=Daedalea quercina L-15889 TaxID=1314783 RepID=A0A165QSY6_9APHY|nr:Di-trans-poly-cis-decaprenylcistransferase [Daedalea quercina L-15889]
MVLSLVSRSVEWLVQAVAANARNVLLAILAAGPIPRHVAFVMDGNRRYARSHHKRVQEGHAEGFMALRRVLEVCMRLNVRCVSVYAFAIENFKRTPEEVDALMTLAETKLLEICQYGDLLQQYGVRLNVLGKTSLLPPKVQVAVRKAEEMTRGNDRAILNLCMPYASRDEIATAVELAIDHELSREAEDGSEHEITEDDITAQLMSTRAGSPPLDLLVRTSGVRRLSDFLLWQCCEDTQLQFSPTYWPDFGLWDFVPIILDYQRGVWAAPARS